MKRDLELSAWEARSPRNQELVVDSSRLGEKRLWQYKENYMNTKKFLSVLEVAQELGVSRVTVYRKIESNVWPSVSIGSRRLIPTAFINKLEAQAMAITAEER